MTTDERDEQNVAALLNSAHHLLQFVRLDIERISEIKSPDELQPGDWVKVQAALRATLAELKVRGPHAKRD